MKCFVTKTGETAYVPSDLEKEVVLIALRHFRNSLPRTGEGADHD